MKSSGFSLLETVFALFLTSVTMLAVAPLFIQAARSNETGADMGSVGVIARDQVEQLVQLPWRDLDPGGSLTADVTGYFDNGDPEFRVRWVIVNEPSATHTRSITVLAEARVNQIGPRRRIELTAIRGR